MVSNEEWLNEYNSAEYNRTTKPKQEKTMKIGEMKESKYVRKEDCEPPIKVTITHLTEDDLAQQGQPPEMKWVLHFKECKPLVVNSTNAQLIAMALGSEETDDWMGKEIVLFNDPNVSFGGKLTGGVRARGVKGQAPVDDFEDSKIPF